MHAGLSREEIRAALGREALETWGAERLEALSGLLDQVAQAIWTVCQEPLAPLAEEPDFGQPPRPGEEGL